MRTSNYTFLYPKNYLYSKPVKGLRGYEVGYGFAFNGKENDNETQTQDYGFRVYDPRKARFLSVDPLTGKYPFYTPYQFAGNMPIKFIDLDGLEPAEPGKEKDDYSEAPVKGKDNNRGWTWDGSKWNDKGNALKEVVVNASKTAGQSQPEQATIQNGPDWASQAIKGYQSGIFTQGDKSLDYGPSMALVPDVVGIQLSGTGIEGIGISQNTALGYMDGKGFFQTVGPGEGVGHDASLSVQFFVGWYSGNDPDNKFGAFTGNSFTTTGGATIFCISHSGDISPNGYGTTSIGQNWNSIGVGLSLGTDDVSTIFSGSVQYQQSFEVMWGLK